MKKPHCDLGTGKIYGCKKGSFDWYHEKGHFKFNSDERFSFLILLKGYFKDIWIFFIMISVIYIPMIIMAFFCWMIYFSFFAFEEWWCNQYAKKKLKNKSL